MKNTVILFLVQRTTSTVNILIYGFTVIFNQNGCWEIMREAVNPKPKAGLQTFLVFSQHLTVSYASKTGTEKYVLLLL